MSNRRNKAKKEFNKRNHLPNKSLSNEETMDGKQGKQFYKADNYAKVKYGNNKDIRQDQNPPSDYIPSDPILKSVGTLSYNTAVGTPIDLDVQGLDSKLYLPGVMTLQMAPTLGMCDDNTSSANVASRDIYSFVRHLNSGYANYDPMDLMIYLGAMDSLFMYHQFLMRLYGVAMTYSAVNRFLPEMLIDAMGVKFSDVRRNLTKLSGFINLLAVNMEEFYVPDVMPILKVHSQCLSNIMKDSDSARANMFVIVPAYFYELNETEEGGGSLVAKAFITNEKLRNPLSRFTVDDLIEYGNDLIQHVLDSQDCGIISGDLMKAYGTRRYYISQMPLDYKVEPVKDQRILSKIHNATMCPFINQNEINKGYFNITQDVNKLNLKFNPRFDVDADYRQIFRMRNRILDMFWENPTAEDNMEATRWMVFGDTTASNTFNVQIFGTEIICGFAIGKYIAETSAANPQGIEWTMYNNGSFIYAASDEDGYQVNQTINHLANFSKFDWAPLLYTYYYDVPEVPGTWSFENVYGDIDNYIVVHDQIIKQMHLAATIAEFGLGQ